MKCMGVGNQESNGLDQKAKFTRLEHRKVGAQVLRVGAQVLRVGALLCIALRTLRGV